MLICVNFTSVADWCVTILKIHQELTDNIYGWCTHAKIVQTLEEKQQNEA